MKDIKIDPKKKDLVKRFSITSEEKEKFKTFQSILSIHNVEMDAVKQALVKHAISIRQRLNINEKDTPKGYERFVDFDPDTYEMLVIDRPILKETKEGGEKYKN